MAEYCCRRYTHVLPCGWTCHRALLPACLSAFHSLCPVSRSLLRHASLVFSVKQKYNRFRVVVSQTFRISLGVFFLSDFCCWQDVPIPCQPAQGGRTGVLFVCISWTLHVRRWRRRVLMLLREWCELQRLVSSGDCA